MILNRQRSVSIHQRTYSQFLEQACKALRVPPESVTVCFVANHEMARWNSAYRKNMGPTDVLSFPSDTAPSDAAQISARKRKSAADNHVKSLGEISARSKQDDSYLGDIAIAPEVARQNARRFGRSFQDEVRILILHGILHLMGYDHETDTGQMNRREHSLRRRLGLG